MAYEIDMNPRVRSYLSGAEPGLSDRLKSALDEIGSAAETMNGKHTLDPRGPVRLYLFLGRHRFDYEIDDARRQVRVISGFARSDAQSS